jgi:hypothetical protein
VALISAMSDWAQTEDDSTMLKIIEDNFPEDGNPEQKKNRGDLMMAHRAALILEGIRNIDPGHLNIVAQVVPVFGQRSGADRNANAVGRKLDREYNGINARSIIREGITSTEDYKDLIRSVLRTMDGNIKLNPRASFLVPEEGRGSFDAAVEVLRKEGTIKDQQWANIRVVYVIQGETPDSITQFAWGVMDLDHDRKVQNAREKHEKILPEASSGYTRLTAALFERMIIGGKEITDPAEIIRMLREGNVGTLVVRKIDWTEIADQHAAWEAVATSL